MINISTCSLDFCFGYYLLDLIKLSNIHTSWWQEAYLPWLMYEVFYYHTRLVNTTYTYMLLVVFSSFWNSCSYCSYVIFTFHYHCSQTKNSKLRLYLIWLIKIKSKLIIEATKRRWKRCMLIQTNMCQINLEFEN